MDEYSTDLSLEVAEYSTSNDAEYQSFMGGADTCKSGRSVMSHGSTRALYSALLSECATLYTVSSVQNVTVMPGLEKWKRMTSTRSVLVRVLADEDDVNEAFGLLAWHAPLPKEEHGFHKISPPPMREIGTRAGDATWVSRL